MLYLFIYASFIPCSSQALEQAAQGSDGVIIPGGVQKTCRCGTLGYGLVGMVVFGWQLDFMILEVFSNLLFYDSTIVSSPAWAEGSKRRWVTMLVYMGVAQASSLM